jgi:PhnB protein
MAHVKAIPQGYTTVTPSIIVRDASKAIEFYKKAFDAKENSRMLGPDNRVMHAEITIGSSFLMLAEEMPGMNKAVETMGGSPVSFYLYFEDADKAYEKAVAAGAKGVMPVAEMFWGDRFGQVEDPFGIKWSVATHVKDLTPEQMKKGMDEWMKQMAGAH